MHSCWSSNVDDCLVQGEILKFDHFKKDGCFISEFYKANNKDEQYKSFVSL